MKLKAGDIIVIVCVLSLSLVLLVNSFVFKGEEGDYVYIRRDGNISEYPLDKDMVLTVQNNGVTLEIELNSYEVGVVSADCPDKLCERSHKISRVGETIVCLPARIVIGISEDERSAYEADGIVG